MALEGELDVAVSERTGAETVAFEFSVTNTGTDPIQVRFPNAGKAEFVVEQAGREIWRFTDGRVFAQVVSSERLAPAETAIYEGEWNDPQPGSYTAVATLRAREAGCEARTEFEV